MDDREYENLIERARLYYRRGDLQGARGLAEQALAIEPDDEWAHALLANILVDAELMGPARVEAQTAVALEPELALAHHALGRVEFAERNLEAAEASLQRAVELEPHEATYYIALIALRRVLEKPTEALIERALELDPNDPEVLTARAYAAYDQRKFDEAEQYAREALEEDPEEADSLAAMGWILLAQGRVAEAHEHARMSLTINPTDRDALRLLGGIKARRNPFLGLWWRYSMWMSTIGDTRSIAVLVVAFIIYRLAATMADDFGHPELATIIRYVWLGLVAYTWIGPAVWSRMLEKDLAKVRLDDDY